MIHFVVDDRAVDIPTWVVDLKSFRRWADDEAFPAKSGISYLLDEVWVDLSREHLFLHNDVKTEINTILRTLAKGKGWGRYFSAGAFFSNVEADFSNQPDGMFVSNESLRAGRVRSLRGRRGGHIELEGSPDMVLEVVGRSTAGRDDRELRDAYFLAGVREYWLINALETPLRFEILRPGRSRFVAVRSRRGWTRSAVFAHSFRLVGQTGEDGYPAFTLEARADAPA